MPWVGCTFVPSERVRIDPIGPKPPVKIGPELQACTGGMKSWDYARNRYTEGGDVDRANRQQKVDHGIGGPGLSRRRTSPTMVAQGTQASTLRLKRGCAQT
jgi:hypothetical protein